MQEMDSIGGGSRLFSAGGDDRSARPEDHHALKCPRCDSLNTKFSYYNNYNLSQPRHFCKACRRYWTKGGVLRNVPVGGGCRKASKRSKPKKATTACGIFSDIGSFSSLIDSTNDRLGSGFSGLEQLQQDQNRQWQQLLQKVDKKEMKLPGGFIDLTVDVELSALQSSRSGNGGGFGTLDWGGTGSAFDLPSTVDHSYWNQSQWTDLDQNSLYLP